jgi:alpha-beta hydrolase superfamily lysophospholipase
MSTQSRWFDAADGLKLHAAWQPAPAQRVRGGAVVVHGYADHGGRYEHVTEHLASKGFQAMAFDYRGHGKAGGQRGHCDRFDQYLGDLEAAIGAMAAEVKDGPLVIVSHSHGGLITLRWLTDPDRAPALKKRVTAAVFSSPFLGLAMKVNPIKTTLGKAASKMLPRLSMPNGIKTADLTHDQAMLAKTEADTLRHPSATARWFTEMQGAQAYVDANATRLAVPSLWLIAGADRLADAKASQRIAAKAGGEKKIVVLDGFFHEVFNEIERKRVFDELDAFLAARAP